MEKFDDLQFVKFLDGVSARQFMVTMSCQL